MFMCVVNLKSVNKLDLTWKQSFLIIISVFFLSDSIFQSSLFCIFSLFARLKISFLSVYDCFCFFSLYFYLLFFFLYCIASHFFSLSFSHCFYFHYLFLFVLSVLLFFSSLCSIDSLLLTLLPLSISDRSYLLLSFFSLSINFKFCLYLSLHV